MKRWALLLLAVLLQFQFAWSTASAYCLHESAGPPTRHFGHHAHVHHADDRQAVDGKAVAKAGAHADCASCHAAGLAALLPDVGLAGTAPDRVAMATSTAPRFASIPPRLPERPQWRRLA